MTKSFRDVKPQKNTQNSPFMMGGGVLWALYWEFSCEQVFRGELGASAQNTPNKWRFSETLLKGELWANTQKTPSYWKENSESSTLSFLTTFYTLAIFVLHLNQRVHHSSPLVETKKASVGCYVFLEDMALTF